MSQRDEETEAQSRDRGREEPADGVRREDRAGTVPDEALPEELVPGPDNPLAEGLPPGETAEGLLDPDQEKHRSNPE